MNIFNFMSNELKLKCKNQNYKGKASNCEHNLDKLDLKIYSTENSTSNCSEVDCKDLK